MSEHRGKPRRRTVKTGQSGKAFDWRRFLIEVGVAILALNLLAAFVYWYFVRPHMRH